MKTLKLLRDVEESIRDEFVANRRVLTFDDYFSMFLEHPVAQTRTAAQYVRDCMEHFGRAEVDRPEGRATRFQLFDCPWDAGRHQLVGQEGAQAELFRLLNNFVRDGRVTRLVLLHGPNGSAKSSMIACLSRALEHYSTLDEGALFKFSWVFPTNATAKKRLGFGGEGARRDNLGSYALLEEEDIAALLPGDLADHPLLLLPRERRARILSRLRDEGRLPADHAVGEYLLDGDLSPRSRAVADALLNSYKGDFQRLLQHVRVERYYLSRRYRRGLVTVEPQLHVDASIRQVTMDQGLASLPPALRNLNLFEPQGDLVDGNRGLIEYNDLLKKPVDAYKYLLATCEKGTVTLPNAILHLDMVFLASSNEQHLSAFKQYPDFTSFKGRMDLVKMPYLRDYTAEQGIYDEQIREQGLSALVTPHTTYVLALWAVLTRLKRPRSEIYPKAIRGVIDRMGPLEKAELYARVRDPHELTADQQRELHAALPELLAEGQDEPDYEGSFGASPREMKQVMLHALQNERYAGLSTLAIFDELRGLVKLKTVYEFLKREPNNGFHDHADLIEQVFERYLDRVNADVQAAMGLVSEEQYVELFSRYILHVSYLLKGEKLYNEKTGSTEPPDERLMDELESTWDVGADKEAFRRPLISRVGVWRLDHPGEAIDYRRLFPELFEALERDYYERQRDTIRKRSTQLLDVLAAGRGPDGKETAADRLDATERERAEATLARLVDQYGYPRDSIADVLSALLRKRW